MSAGKDRGGLLNSLVALRNDWKRDATLSDSESGVGGRMSNSQNRH